MYSSPSLRHYLNRTASSHPPSSVLQQAHLCLCFAPAHIHMSLVQRVTPIEGTDREPPQLPEEWLSPSLSPYRHPNGYGTINGFAASPHRHQHQHQLRGHGSVKSLRHVVSYDVLPHAAQPSLATHPTGGITAYKVSTARRLGESPYPKFVGSTLTFRSSGICNSPSVLACLWHRLWLCGAEACTHQ